jgi:microcin C transport system substrate-binding protein
MRTTWILLAASLLSLGLAAPAAAEQGVTVSHGISAFGDLKYPADFAHFDHVNPDAPQGGTMSFRGTGASQTFDSLNQFILKGEPAQGLERLYDSLLTASADEPDSFYGLIAASLEYPADRSWVIFTLRPEARFSDGVPITAADVVFTFETLKSEGAPTYQILLGDVASVEALDPQRVRFRFAEGVPSRDLPAQVGNIPILPAHYYREVNFNASTLVPPVGSGPFVVDRVESGRSIRYCRTPDYWGRDLPVNRGVNNFQCVVYEYFADNTAAFEALKVGNYLFHQEFTSAIWATGYDFPAVNNGWITREAIPDARPSGTQGFWINLRREKFADPRLREALGVLFNFEWTNATLFYGIYKQTDSFWENTATMQAEDLPQGEELAVLERFRDRLAPEIFTEPAFVPAAGGPQPNDRRMARRAAALLEEAGWIVGPDGMRRNAAGEVLELEILDDNPAFRRIVDPYVANLRAAGIDARYEVIDAAQMQQRQKDFDYDMTPGRLVMALSPSVELRSLLGSQGAAAAGTLNLAGVADPVVDGLIEEIIAATTRDEMEARVRALDRVLRAQHIWVPNWYSGSYLVAYWDLFGRPAVQPPYARGDDFWWFDAAKYRALQAAGALR